LKTDAALSAAGFGKEWFALCVVLAIHIVDEASTGFLAVYNPTVTILRQHWGWFPLPPMGMQEYLIVHILICGALFCLTPVASRGTVALRPWAWAYAVIMFLNGLGHTIGTVLGHTLAAVRFARPAPGFYSSPLLFAASIWLMLRLRRTAMIDFKLPSGY
jgi:hypothetical protein